MTVWGASEYEIIEIRQCPLKPVPLHQTLMMFSLLHPLGFGTEAGRITSSTSQTIAFPQEINRTPPPFTHLYLTNEFAIRSYTIHSCGTEERIGLRREKHLVQFKRLCFL